MGRPTTKTDLLTAATTNYEKLNKLISGMTEKELSTPFDFSDDEKKKEAHWKRDINLRDVLVHLYDGTSFYWTGYIQTRMVTRNHLFQHLITGEIMAV